MNDDGHDGSLEDDDFRRAWLELSAELEKSPSNEYLGRQAFWLCYNKLKAIQLEIGSRPEQDRQPNITEQQKSNWLISKMRFFGPPPPHQKCYGPMFFQLRDTGHHYETFVRMLLDYGPSFFSQEDHVPWQGEKYESPSQLVKAARMVAKAWLANGRTWQLDLSAVLGLLQYAEENALDTTKIWLEYDHAKCLVKAGQLEAARDHVLAVLRKKSTEGWAWAALAATYRKEDPDASIVCFCKALSFEQDPSFTIPQRKGLIPLLVRKGDFETASMLVQSLARIYSEKGWHLKSDIQDLLAEDWYDASVKPEPLAAFIRKTAVGAERYLYGETTSRIAIVDGVHKSGKGFNAFVSADEKYSVRKAVMANRKLPSPGQWVRLSIVESDDNEHEVIAATLADAHQSDAVTQIKGLLRVNPKGFAFVDNTFIAPHLIDGAWDGQEVLVTQVWDVNPKKGEKSWRGIKVELVA